jgi:hypothetical protein
MMIDAGLVPNWREILSEPIGSPNLVDTWMRQGSRTPGAIGSPAAPLQATAANSFQPFGTSGQFAPGSTTSSQPLYDTRSFAAPSDGSAEAEDRKNIRVLRRFIEAPDGSLIPDPLTGPDQPQSVQTSDLLSSKPMTSNPPPIFGFGDRSATSDDGDDFFSRFIKPLLQQ